MAERDIYRENILEHYKRPKNFGKMENPDSQAHDSNPICGDEISFYLKFSSGRLSDVRFEGSACAICLASASMLSEEAKGKGIADVQKIGKGKVLSLLGIELGPMRLKCALLPLKVLKLALYGYMKKRLENEK
ncbi:MAG: iron-sulfur cluster assembly scaffold protein [Candidatus Anstonellaceae archaeon]